MLTTIKGTYHDGLVELNEPAPATGAVARSVLVVFLESEPIAAATSYRFSWQDPDSPANQQPVSAASVADKVIAERQEGD